MKEELRQRRAEHLNMTGLGIELSEIVKQLSKKYSVSRAAIYYDDAKMGEWAPAVSQLEHGQAVTYVILNALRRLVPRAWQTYTQATTVAGRLNAIREMRSIYMDIVRILINTGKIPRSAEKFELEDVTPYFDIPWEQLEEEERNHIRESARIIIKGRSKERSQDLH